MKYLVTGGCGFLGSNLAKEVLERGDELVVLDNLYREGTEKNLDWLRSLGNFKFYRLDIRNVGDVEHVMATEKPDVVFHVAGQVAMITSLERPRFDFEINALGTLNVLESVRKYAPNAIVTFSSTNKVFGDLEDLEYQETDSRYQIPAYPNGLDEEMKLDFRTPYGCSKGTADQYMRDYYKNYGIKTIVFRHSSIYGGRQFSTFDQGWIGWFAQKALAQKNKTEESFTIAGSGKQVRDVLFASDLISCYFQAIENIEKTKGEVFNIGGGMNNSLSLLELFSLLEGMLDIKLNFTHLPPRQSDQKSFVANVSKAEKYFNWKPQVSKEEGVSKMLEWVSSLNKE